MIALSCLLLTLALPTPPGGWAAFGDALRAGPVRVMGDGSVAVGSHQLSTPPGEARATRSFIEAWRTQPRSVDALLRWVVHPSTLARRVAHAALRRRARSGAVRPSGAQIERLLEALRGPGWRRSDRADALRTLSLIGGQAGADRLAQAWDTLPDDSWRLRAVAVLARAPSRTTRGTLLRCARAPHPLLQRRCIAALEPQRSRRAP